MSDAKAEKTSGASLTEGGDKIDRIREILLGSSLDEFATRLGRLEGRLQEVDTELRGELEQRIGSIDASVAARIEEAARTEAESRQKLVDELGALRKELAKVREELHSSLKRSLAELEAEKVDRVALSRILADASARLQGESAPAARESRKNG
jgi:vacuolar-type H+-ATPase subunit I/STV1